MSQYHSIELTNNSHIILNLKIYYSHLILNLLPKPKNRYAIKFITYFHVKHNEEQSSTTTSTFPYIGGYLFHLTWYYIYPNITASSYAISGIKMGIPNMPLSYTVNLTVNPTGGIFTFILDAHSSIVYAGFSIVLVSSCNNGIIHA
jgi:hypothetical protein